jgi:outer membrane lipoprotein-sorting protein
MKFTLLPGILTATAVTITAATALLPPLLTMARATTREKAKAAKYVVKKATRAASPDPRTVALLKRVRAAYQKAGTFTADFTYAVTSVKRQQVVEGTVLMKKPNFARVTYATLREPAFPSLIASDGKSIYTFTPDSFDVSTRRFRSVSFDSQRGAKQASGFEAGGGKITSTPVALDGTNIRLWDATPVQAFFDPFAAIRNSVYIADPEMLQYEGKQILNGVTYQVLRHRYPTGNIAGGEQTPFEQRLYIGPDYLIHQYVLEFRSGGRPGVQVVNLRNIRVNQPMRETDFSFTPPQDKP